MRPASTTDLQRIGGDLIHGGHRPLGTVSLDSRTIGPHSTFFCVPGPNFDGHDFAPAAAAAGARVIVCARAAARRVVAAVAEYDVTVVAVNAPIYALGMLALRYRQRYNGTVIGLTGSSGKTTTKEMIAAVLGATAPTHRTPGNLNNHLGVPLTLLGLGAQHRYAVIEMGMSARGEIARLAEMSRPHLGVITSVGAAHLEKLGHIGNVAEAKGELLRALPPDGVGIIPSNIDQVWRLTRHIRAPLIAVGRRAEDDVRLTHLREGKAGAMARVHVDGQMFPLRLQMAGLHNLSNAALAIAVARQLDLDIGQAVKALGEVPAPRMRGEIRRLPDGTPVVLDCYNANPQSTRASLQAFVKRAPQGIAVIGDMLELGEVAPVAHAAMGQTIAAASPDLRLVAVGRFAGLMVQAARESGLREAIAVPDAAAATTALADRAAGRPILLKGSRGIGLERVFDDLSREEA